MWIASRYGFFSIVKKDDGFHVRARSRRDLEILREACIKWVRPERGLILEIKDTPNSDYCSRIVLGDVHLITDVLANSVNYPSLRKEIEATPEQADKAGLATSSPSQASSNTCIASYSMTNHDAASRGRNWLRV